MLSPGVPLAVLVADADPYVSRVVSAGLSRDGLIRVTAAFHGRDALAAAVALPFHVILWSVREPTDDGNLPRVRALCPHAALILMTTDDRLRLGAEFTPLDVSGVLVKPFSLDSLHKRVHDALTISVSARSHAYTEFLRPGQQVSIVSTGGRWETRIYSYDADTVTIVGAPRTDEAPDLAPGRIVTLEVTAENALYFFRSRLRAHLLTPVPVWTLTLPRTIHRRQRRRHPRVSVHLSAALMYDRPRAEPSLVSPGPAGLDSATPCSIENLSLGGALIHTGEPIVAGSPVRLAITGEHESGLWLSGRVQRCLPRIGADLREHEAYAIAIHFDALTSRQRRSIGRLLVGS